MRHEFPDRFSGERPASVDVSIIMPCLNEAISLPTCIAMASEALARIEAELGLTGEIIIADNGSTDGSQEIAESMGARVVCVPLRGYGAALIGGGIGAHGRFLVFGDADGSYDFREGVAMVEKLVEGADVCMGSRFKGGIAPGAMPWKNRYIGNPVLTGILNLMYGARVSDAHCGLRAVTKQAFMNLRLSGQGMEFASEMVIKAALQKLRIEEVPATLSPDLRERAPHLRPWRDGWRHLRYLLMLSPLWLFAVPAGVAAAAATIIFAGAFLHLLAPSLMPGTFGNYWVIAGAALAGTSHLAAIMTLAGHLHGIKTGYRRPGRHLARLQRILSLETMLVAGLASGLAGLVVLANVSLSWSMRGFGPAFSVLPAVVGTLLVTLGVQNVFGGFLLSIIGGNEARFLAGEPGQGPAHPLELRKAA